MLTCTGLKCSQQLDQPQNERDRILISDDARKNKALQGNRSCVELLLLVMWIGHIFGLNQPYQADPKRNRRYNFQNSEKH